MLKQSTIMVLVTLFLLYMHYSTATQVFHIKPENNNSTCPAPCFTLDNFSHTDTSSYGSVSLVFLPGVHTLDSPLILINKKNSSLKVQSANVIVQCGLNGHVGFQYMTGIQIEHISFVACSSYIKILDSTQVELNDVAITNVQNGALVLGSSSVLMNNLTISKSVANSAESVDVRNCDLVFTGNCVFENTESIGGFAVQDSNLTFNGNISFVRCKSSLFGLAALDITRCQMFNYGDLKFLENSGPQSLSISDSVVTSLGSFEFIGNEAGLNVPFEFEVVMSVINSTLSFTSFVFNQNQGMAMFNFSNFTVTDLLEVSDNVLIYDFPHATINLNDCTVKWNGNISFLRNQAIFSKQGFLPNYADNANAIVSAAGFALVYGTMHVTGDFKFLSNVGFNKASCMLMYKTSCTFNGSTVINGSVSEKLPHFFQYSNVTFIGKTLISNNLAIGNYGGSLGLSQTSLRLEGNYIFENNSAPSDKGGAIYAIDSKLILAGTGNFTRNLAKSGGALHLFYQSKLIILPGSFTIFYKNIASTGGAILVEEFLSFINCTNDNRLRNVYSKPPICFFEIDSLDQMALMFSENEASNGGTALYGGMLNSCLYTADQNISALQVFEDISEFRNATKSLPMSSDPFHLCFCVSGSPMCQIDYFNVQIRRGEEFSVNVSVQNEFNVGIIALVRSYLVSDFDSAKSILGNDGILQEVNNTCSELKFRVSSSSKTEHLIMYAEGPCKDVGNSTKTINIQFFDCPIGFVLDVDTCVCDLHLLPYTSSCNIDTGGIGRPTNFWVGLSYNDSGNFTGLKLFPNCPFDYCLFPSAPVIMTSPDTQCNYNRSGVLCGSCGTNKSLLLGSSNCSECSDYYLFLLIPFALMGILLVTCLFLLNLTVQTGAIHGLIFYANIVAVNKAVMVPSGTFKGLSIFLAWLNLDFGIEICFFNGMNQYAKTWLQFVFPGYLLFLVLLIIVVCKLSIPASEKLAKLGDPVFVLATVILLSYTKIVRTILAGLSFASIELSNDLQSAMVWLFDGNLVYAQGNHAILLAFSLAVLIVFVFPYTTMLTFAQFVTESCCISRRSLYKTCYELFKRYHTPYKPNHRYWPGLFLIIRIIILVTFAVNFLGNPSTNLLAISTVCICTGSYTWIVGGVYELKLLKNASEEKRYVNFINNWLLDTLESLFLLNLGIFTAATYHILATTNSVEDQAILADISLAFTFVLFLLIVGILMYLRFVEYSQYRKNLANGDDENEEETRRLLDVSANYGAAKANPTVQVIPPPREKFADFSQLREPLLDNQ